MTDVPPPGGWGPPPPQYPPQQYPPQQYPPAYGHATGYGYATGPGPAGKPVRGLGTALCVLLGLTVASGLFAAFALYDRASLLGDVDRVSLSELEAADDAAAAAGVLVLLAFVVSGIVWLVWQHRHARNAETLGQRGGLGAGWAVGGWFIPLGNLVLPQLQLLHSAKATDRAAGGSGSAPGVLLLWWVLQFAQFAAFILLGEGVGFNDPAEVADIEEFRRNDQAGAIVQLVTVTAGLAAIGMVSRLSARQHDAFRAQSRSI